MTRKGEGGGGGGQGNFTLQREGGGGGGLFLGYSSKEGGGRGGRGDREWCVRVTPKGSWWWTSAATSLFASRGSAEGTGGYRGDRGGGRGGEGGGGEGTAAAAAWPPLQRGSGTPNFTTARPTNTVTNTVLPSDDVMGTKAPASPEPTFWQVCSTVRLMTRPSLGVRGRSSWENSSSACLATRPGLAPGVVGPSTVSTTNKIQILLIAGGQRPHRQASNLRERERFWR